MICSIFFQEFSQELYSIICRIFNILHLRYGIANNNNNLIQFFLIRGSTGYVLTDEYSNPHHWTSDWVYEMNDCYIITNPRLSTIHLFYSFYGTSCESNRRESWFYRLHFLAIVWAWTRLSGALQSANKQSLEASIIFFIAQSERSLQNPFLEHSNCH